MFQVTQRGFIFLTVPHHLLPLELHKFVEDDFIFNFSYYSFSPLEKDLPATKYSLVQIERRADFN